MLENRLKRLILDALCIPRGLPYAGRNWLLLFTTPDTGRCRRIVDAERPPTPWETGGGSVMVESEKLADTSSTGEKIL